MEYEILTYLRQNHTGKNRAIQSSELEARFHIQGAKLRVMVNTLRSDGHPICSDESGYFYAATRAEVRYTIRQLRSRISKIVGAMIGLVHSLERLPDDSGQISLLM